MKNIFLDCGANNNCSARLFRKLYDEKMKYKIYSFECEPKFKDRFSDIQNLEFIPKAVWIEDGALEFYRDITGHKTGRMQYIGGSLLKAKTSAQLDKKNPLVVESIDFSKWVKETLNKEDYIILKMDIEGAEYKVLEKMFREGTFDYMNELWIEWHWKKVQMTEDEHKRIADQIKIPVKKWAGIELAKKIFGKGA